ncbi:MAG TPA: hypothetical protein VIH57_01975 [Bacteroidales bacterium]
MTQLRTLTIIVLAVSLFMAGCDIKKNTASPDAVFTTVYNDNDMNSSYYPLGIVQQSDGQLIMLAGIANDTSKYTWTGTYIMAADAQGKFLWGSNMVTGYVNPVPNLIYTGGDTYFICMDEVTLQANLMIVNNAEKNAGVVKTFTDIIYPLYTYQTSDGGLLIISYDRASRSTRITKTDASFNEVWQKDFNVMEDAEAKVIGHLSKLGQQFPFFAGEVSDGGTVTHYFVNSFFNYSFSMLFLKASNGSQAGVVNGYRYDGAVSAALHLTGTKFALSRYTFGDNYLMPQAVVVPDSLGTTDDLAGTKFSELTSDARVLIREKDSGSQKRTIFITSTKIGQLVMYQFAQDTTKLLRSDYFGHSNPVDIASAIDTKDGGMLLLCRLTVAGRFPRMALYKVSAGNFK